MARRPYDIWPALALVLAGCAALCLAGCAAERAITTADPTMTAGAIRGDGMALVGVTVVEEVEQVRPPLIEALERTLGEKRPDLPVKPAASVRDSLGLAEYRRVLAGYQRTGALDAEALTELSSRVRAASRFALLGRVEKTTIRPPAVIRPGDDRYGTPIASRSSKRDARIRMTVYDLSNRRLVWSAVYASSSENSIPDSTAHLPYQEGVRNPAFPGGPLPDPTLETPSLAEALLEAYRAFAADLPQ